MPTSSGITGTGATLSGATTGAVGEIISVSGPGATATDIDITNFASTAKEFIGGLVDWGEMTIGVIYESTLAQTLDGRVSQTSEVWTFTFSNTDTFTFTGYIKGLGIENPMDDTVTQEITIKLTGSVAPVFA